MKRKTKLQKKCPKIFSGKSSKLTLKKLNKICRRENEKQNTSKSSDGLFTKKNFREEYCFKTVDWLK